MHPGRRGPPRPISAEPTVKNHVTAILKALKVSNRTEAVIAANQLGWEFPASIKPKDALAP